MNKIELLAPAGTKEAFVGAINAGANAIFMAGYRFGARAFAENFTENDLIEAIEFAHLRNVFVYVVVNTLIFNEEIADLLAYTDTLVMHHVDGLIVQDLGVMDLLCKRYPNVSIHASTQTNAHTVEQVAYLKSLGVKRVILARETSIDVIKEIKKHIDIEIEVFIHGALCVSYSGQCLISSILSNRSGNRGQCAYHCRLPYQLFKGNQMVNDTSYLMSPKDLMTLEYIDELIKIGVDSLKIEGRMRKKEYVMQTVLTYREKIDAYYQQKHINKDAAIDLLKRTFNRQFTKGYMFFETPKGVNNHYRPNHQGVHIGEVLSYEKGMAKVYVKEPLRNGDGFRVVGTKDYGNTVTFMKNQKGDVIKASKASDVIYLKVKEIAYKGDKLYKTTDSALESSLMKYQMNDYQMVPIFGYVEAFQNTYLTMSVWDKNGHESTIVSDYFIPSAEQVPTTENQLRQSLSKLGDTPFYYESFCIQTDEQSFVPVKIANALRRAVIKDFIEKKLYREKGVIVFDTAQQGFKYQDETKLIAKVRTKDQLNAAYEMGIPIIYYEDILSIKEHNYPKAQLFKVTKRIQGNDVIIPTDSMVIQEIGTLQYLDQVKRVVTDEFLNVTNIYTARLLSNHHVDAVTLSSELNKQQVLSFFKHYENAFKAKPNLEYIVYGYKDLMISKYCPVAKTFDQDDHCGLCFKDQYYLVNHERKKMALLNDGHCNMRIMDYMPTSLIEYLDELKAANVHRLRMDFTLESANETRIAIKAFQEAFNKKPYLWKIKSRLGNYIDE